MAQLILVGLPRQATQCSEQITVACARKVTQQQIGFDTQQRSRRRRERQRRQRQPSDNMADRRVEQAILASSTNGTRVGCRLCIALRN